LARAKGRKIRTSLLHASHVWCLVATRTPVAAAQLFVLRPLGAASAFSTRG